MAKEFKLKNHYKTAARWCAIAAALILVLGICGCNSDTPGFSGGLNDGGSAGELTAGI